MSSQKTGDAFTDHRVIVRNEHSYHPLARMFRRFQTIFSSSGALAPPEAPGGVSDRHLQSHRGARRWDTRDRQSSADALRMGCHASQAEMTGAPMQLSLFADPSSIVAHLYI